MSFARSTTGLLLVAALLCTAIGGWCAEHNVPGNLDQQIAERTRQYQESLRQRAQQLSPSLQSKIDKQVQQTVAKGLEKWKNREIDVRLALPGWAESCRVARFVARHLPFSGAPSGSFEFGGGLLDAVLTVTTVQYVLKVLTISIADSAIVRTSSVRAPRQNGNALSYFIQVVCTIVQRQ